MADSNLNPKELINQAISIIERERQLYGDFTVKSSAVDNTQQTTDYNEESSAQSVSDENKIAESSTQNTAKASSSKESDYFDPQDELFKQDVPTEIYYQIDECNTLEELEKLCRKADVLRTDLEGTQLVFGTGNPNADLMLIGEAPGAEEDKQGEPFVGKAGQLLNKILDAINFKREDVYIANILKHRPPNNRNPKPEERKRSLPFLLRQIDLVNPKLILTLGKVATQTLLEKNDSLSRMRGQFHKFRDKYELLPTYHPAALLRSPKWKRPTWEDVQMLRKRYDELDGQP